MAFAGPNELAVKVVLAGAPGCGKSDILRALATRLGGVPVREGAIGGTRVRRVVAIWPNHCPDGRTLRVGFYALSGPVRYNAPEELLMRGADALLLVIDVSPEALKAGGDALRRSVENVRRAGMELQSLPVALQYHRVERHSGFDADRMDAWLGVPTGLVPRFVEESAAPDRPGGAIDSLIEALMRKHASVAAGDTKP